MLSLLGGLLPPVYAAPVSPDLTFIELKPTGTESVVILNTSPSSLNLQNYLLQYFNKSTPTSFSSPTSSQTLPDVSLAPNQSLLLNSDSSATCGAAAVAPLGFSLSDTSGYIMLVKVETQTDGSIVYRPQDRVGWTSATTGADIVKEPSATTSPKVVWYRKLSTGAWQQAQLSGDCSILLAVTAPPAGPTFVAWATGADPPATIIKPEDAQPTGPAIPAADIGLAAPKITEILPNPAEPQTDAEDEFIELYNPNSAEFDLSGFRLEVGTTTLHSYTFPLGTHLPAKGFKAFQSIDTRLSLSNSGGQVRLFDPLGSQIGQTDVYDTAKDGQGWALANGKWYWTTTPSAGAPNIVTQPLTIQALSLGTPSVLPDATTDTAEDSATAPSPTKSSKPTTKKSTPPKEAAATQSTTTPSPKTKAANTNTKPASSKTAAAANSSAPTPAKQPAPLHWLILAVIGGLALLYALYEYRHDLANRLYRRRRNRAAGRIVRPITPQP